MVNLLGDKVRKSITTRSFCLDLNVIDEDIPNIEKNPLDIADMQVWASASGRA